jgi:periplasmic divalent cation tolerance protein
MIRFVLTTFPDTDAAERAVRLLVEKKLAACGTILPDACSIYRWKGAVEESSEAVVLFKTTETTYPDLERRLREIHPYENPEIAAFAAADISKAYADWVMDSVAPSNASASPAR